MKRYCADDDPLEILEERESILYLLPQTTPERLQKNHAAYSINPKSRYNNLSEVIPPGDISHLYDTDNSDALQLSRSQSALRSSLKARPARGELAAVAPPPGHLKRGGGGGGGHLLGTIFTANLLQKEGGGGGGQDHLDTPLDLPL